MFMRKTVPSYRMAIEEEIIRWKPFREPLPSEEDKQAFDAVMDMVRGNGMTGSAACNLFCLSLWL